MPTPRVPMSPSTFVYLDNTPVANGHLIVRPYSVAESAGLGYQLQSNAVRIELDVNGTIINNEFVIDTVYVVSVYNAKGQLVAEPRLIVVSD